MTRSPITPNEYLSLIEAELAGNRNSRARLLTELGDHIEDALAVDPTRDQTHLEATIARLGAPSDVTTPWRTLIQERRAQTRRRAALLTLTTATAITLGIAQHASGHRNPNQRCTTISHGAHTACARRPVSDTNP